MHSLYLLFNEGYNSSHPDQLIRHELCGEAMRLCLLLVNNKITSVPNANALLGLMCFQASRADARASDDRAIILLKDQDRSRWSQPLIEKGKYYLEQAAEGGCFSEYHVEAAIAGCHLHARSFNETDWRQILHLYKILAEMKPGPIVELNMAIATGYANSPAEGIRALQDIQGLEHHYLYHSALGDFYVEVGNGEEAGKSYQKALTLTPSNAEKKLLLAKMQSAGSRNSAT